MAIRWMLIAALVLAVGCEASAGGKAADVAGLPPMPGAQSEAPPEVEPPQPEKTTKAVTLRTGEVVESSIETEADNELIEAQKGVAQKGRSLDEYEGMVVTPIKSLFAVQERAIFDIQIPQALNLYKPLNGGKGPQTHEEFMEKVIKFNRIELPGLPPGHRYRYDPQIEKLLVERPVKRSEK